MSSRVELTFEEISFSLAIDKSDLLFRSVLNVNHSQICTFLKCDRDLFEGLFIFKI